MTIYWSNNENRGNVFLQSLQLLTDALFFHLVTGSFIYIYQNYKNTKKFWFDMLLFLLFMSLFNFYLILKCSFLYVLSYFVYLLLIY